MTLHAVVFEEDGWLVAQGLELDIGAQAKSYGDLLYELARTLAGTILICEQEGIELSSIPEAPREYWPEWLID